MRRAQKAKTAPSARAGAVGHLVSGQAAPLAQPRRRRHPGRFGAPGRGICQKVATSYRSERQLVADHGELCVDPQRKIAATDGERGDGCERQRSQGSIDVDLEGQRRRTTTSAIRYEAAALGVRAEAEEVIPRRAGDRAIIVADVGPEWPGALGGIGRRPGTAGHVQALRYAETLRTAACWAAVLNDRLGIAAARVHRHMARRPRTALQGNGLRKGCTSKEGQSTEKYRQETDEPHVRASR